MQPTPLKILLIEHEDAFARTMAAELEAARDVIAGAVVAHSFDVGLARLRTEPFDVVILEFFLPDGAGVANISLLKHEAPRVPVIVIGGADDESVAITAVHAGAQDYLVREQTTPRELLRTIRYAVERQQAELALFEAEEKYRGIFDHLVEGIFQTTPDGQYLLANAALARIYGYSSPDELKRSVTDIARRLYVQPGRREEFKRIMEKHDTITDFESEIFRKDGSTIWISENCHAMRDARGRLLYYEGTVEDITQRRQAEENLRHSESLYHSLVETLPQNIFRKDLQERFTFANQKFCKAMGRSLEEIVGRTDQDFFPPELAAKYQKDDVLVMSSGRSLDSVEQHQLPDGSRIFVQVVKNPIFNAAGQIIGLQGMFWDITEQKLAEERVRRAQESLRESETLYHSLVDTMPHNIFRKDREGRYTFANRQFCRTVGRPLKKILGRTIHDFFPPALAAKRQEDDLSVMREGKTFETVEENQFPGGEHQYIHVLKMPVRDANGNVTGLQGMFWDITAQKLAEERIRQANAELARSQEELRVKNLQMEEDLKMAREIQLTMLPQQYPVFPRGAAPAESAFQFTHRYHPTGTVGGDFFSVSALSDEDAAVFICDVSGHGVRSALVTAIVRALLEELKSLAGDPGQFLTKLNSDLMAILKHAGTPVLTTAFYLVANSSSGRMRFASAGHPKPLHVQRAAGRVEPLKNTAGKRQPALGLFEGAAYQTCETRLAPGDLMMLFTDGLYEVHDQNQQLYTEELLAGDVRKRIELPAARLFDELLREIEKFAVDHQFVDDVCIVGIELAGPRKA